MKHDAHSKKTQGVDATTKKRKGRKSTGPPKPPRPATLPFHLLFPLTTSLSFGVTACPRWEESTISHPKKKRTQSRRKVDSDHAGCLRTRWSTPGIGAHHEKHVIKAAKTTLTIIALSSGESAFYAIVRGTATALGMGSLARDHGHEVKVALETTKTCHAVTARPR